MLGRKKKMTSKKYVFIGVVILIIILLFIFYILRHFSTRIFSNISQKPKITTIVVKVYDLIEK